MFPQFSYASWKPTPESRAKAAKEKLLMLDQQAKVLGAKNVIPFASYIYFSAADNAYMNDGINTPWDVVKFARDNNREYNVLVPYFNELVYPFAKEELERKNEIFLNDWQRLFEGVNCSLDGVNLSTAEEKSQEIVNSVHTSLVECEKRLAGSSVLFKLLLFTSYWSSLF